MEEKLSLTPDEAYSIAEHIDATLLGSIRDNPDIDSMQWLRNVIHGYEKLCRYGHYTGLTENSPEE